MIVACFSTAGIGSGEGGSSRAVAIASASIESPPILAENSCTSGPPSSPSSSPGVRRTPRESSRSSSWRPLKNCAAALTSWNDGFFSGSIW